MICPNKVTYKEEWKNLVKEVGENKAYLLWNKEDSTLSDLKITKDKPEKNDLQQLADKTKLFLQKKLAILENKNITNKKQKENELKRIIDNIKSLDEISTINVFIEESYEQIKKAEYQFDNLIKNKDNFNKHEMIDRLSSFNDFANGYSILDEISKSDIEEYFKPLEKGLKESSYSTQDKLSYAILAKEKIKQRYLNQGIPLLADYLLEFKSETLDENVKKQIEAEESRLISLENNTKLNEKAKERRIKEVEDRIDKLKGFNLDKKNLIKQLKLASQDEGAIDFMFSPLISSNDSVLALFAKAVKSQLENARLEDITFAEEAQKAFDEFSKTKGNKDNVDKFNNDLFEIIEKPIGKDEEGNIIYTKQKSFVQKYDISKYEKNKNELFNKLGSKPIDNKVKLKEWNKIVSEWFKDNTKPKSKEEINEIISKKDEELSNGIITETEYENWKDSVINEYNGNITYKGELSEPSNKYLNSKWLKLYNENGVPLNESGKYHKFLVESYLKGQEKLPENFRKGYILPSIQKSSLERTQTNGIGNTVKTKLKESAFKQSYDTEYGLAGLNETDAKFLPVYFTQNMEADDVSSDLISSILRFNSMVNRYTSLNEINGEISLTKTVIGERETIETNSKGQKIMDAFASKMGYNEFIRKNGESYSKKHIDSFIDMIVYGEMQKYEEILGLDAGKLTNTITGFSAVTTIALDLLKGVSNNLQGNIQIAIEASAGSYFNRSNIRNGKLHYAKSISSFLSDFNTIAPKTLPSKLVEHWDAIQGKFKDEYGRDVSGSTVRKLFRSNTLFLNQNIAEHELQISTFFGVLDKNKVLDNETKEQISLLDAYEKYGLKDIYNKTDFTEKRFKDIQNRLHAINKRLHGIYNDFDKGTAQRYSLGRLAIMYRKHLIPSYKRRFKSLSSDQEAGDINEGFYRTFWNVFVRDLRDMKLNISKNWSTYSDFEKAQIKRTAAEASFILALSVIVIGLKALGNDDKKWKKNYMYNFLLYQAIRMRSETSSYISPLDAYRVVKSPSAMTTTLERSIKFTDQLLFTWDPNKLQYKKKSGIFNKGTNKSWAYFLKLSGLSGYNSNPEEAVKAFESTLNK